jgi:pentapeptide repeat protein
MSDEQGEQTPADAWGQPISAERQAELKMLADRQREWAAKPARARGDSVFKAVRLTGAEVFWLVAYTLVGPDGDIDSALAHLHAGLVPAASYLHLEDAALVGAHLERAMLTDAHLEGASILGAHLEGADLADAHLEGANLYEARLERAILYRARLEGANLAEASLEDADLRGARFDENSTLTDTSLGPGIITDWLDRLRGRNRNAALGDIRWHDIDLTGVPWERIPCLGDERYAGLLRGASTYRDVVRAYRQVAARLRDQGMADAADRFAYRAQVRERGVLLRELRLPQYLGSWILAILAGYGYRPGRTLFWYLAVIAGFTVLYMQATTGWIPFGLPAPSALAPLPWYEALILSVSSFHGRGFFQPLQSLGDPIAALAAIEAVVGLFIEIAFIATFTQRFFGSR